jgi:pimeloyl-ACP methyl ester carboxylesterase
MATFVLVHGSWHGGWCWQRVAPVLRRLGHEVYAPTLTGLGERSHLVTRQTGLELHAQDILQVLEYEDLNDVVLVGHSYAGLIIASTAERVPRRVARLIYLDAFIPHDGKSAFELMPPGTEERWTEMARGNDKLVPPMSPEAMGITDAAVSAWVQSRLTPMPLLTHQQRFHLISGQSRRLPQTYILCTGFGFQGIADEAKSLGWPCFQLETGHDAMLTMPDQLAGTLDKSLSA